MADWAVLSAGDARRRALGRVVGVIVLAVVVAAKACTTDSVLLLFVTVAQLCLYAMWRGSRGWGVWLTMALAVGLAGLTKGPVVLGVMGTTCIALWVVGRYTPRAHGGGA